MDNHRIIILVAGSFLAKGQLILIMAMGVAGVEERTNARDLIVADLSVYYFVLVLNRDYQLIR